MRSGKHIKQWRVKKAFKYQQKPQTSNATKLAFHAKRLWTCTPSIVLDTLETKLILTHLWDLPDTGYFHSKNWHWNLTDININQFGSSLIHEIDIVMLWVSASTNMVILISENWFEHWQKIWSYPFQKIDIVVMSQRWASTKCGHFHFKRIWPCNWHGSTNRHVITLEMQLDWRRQLKRGRR
jgi:hypothetical protein